MARLVTFLSVLCILISQVCSLWFRPTTTAKNFDVSESFIISPDVPLILRIPESGSVSVTLDNIPDVASFVVFQSHSHNKEVTVTTSTRVSPSNSVTATDAGIVTALLRGQSSVTYYINSKQNIDVNILVLVKWHRNTDPVPGGCNQEFNLELDPNLRIDPSYGENILDYQYGNEGWARGSRAPSCENQASWSRLRYDFYVYYLGEMDYSEKGLFEAMRRMMTAPNIVKYGTKMSEHYRGKAGNKPSLAMASFHGIGVIYNVIVTDDNGFTESTAYVPAAVYNCNLGDDGTCSTNNDVPMLLATGIAGLFGLLLCFFGHRLFKLQQFLIGTFTFTLVVYILFASLSNLGTPVSVGLAVGCGVVAGILWLLFWCCCGVPVLSVLLTGLLLGYLVTCIIFYTPFGNLSAWELNFNYGMTFACGVLLVPVILLYFTKTLSIVASAVIGSYLMTLTASIALHTIIHHIALHSIFKATLPGYIKVKIYPPFQRNDMILSGVWAGLTVLGILFQFVRERNRPHFPECPRERRKRRCELRAQFNEAERRPLLIDYRHHDDDIQQGIDRAFSGYGTQRQRSDSGVAPPAYSSLPNEVAPPRSSSPPPPYNPIYETESRSDQPA